MRLLVLGGTGFIGRHLVEHALNRSHHVTIFNRGRRNPLLHGDAVTRLIGDRDTGDLSALASGEWDAAVDLSGFRPGQVRASTAVLGDRVGHYTLVSSIAVYAHKDRPDQDEDAPLRAWRDGDDETFSWDAYGALKVGAERAAIAAYPGRSVCVRAGAVTGPHDTEDDFVPWALGMAYDEVVPCGARADQPVQMLDVRDLAAFLVLAGEQRLSGPYNVLGEPLTFARMLESCGDARVEWGAEADGFIIQPSDGSQDGLFRLDTTRAETDGLTRRPFAETCRDTLAWADAVRATELPGWLGALVGRGLGTAVRGEALRDWGASQTWRVRYTAAGDVIVKYGAGELAREAEVYSGLLAPLGLPAPRLLAAHRDGDTLVFALTDAGAHTLEQRPTDDGFRAAARLLAQIRRIDASPAATFRIDVADQLVRARHGLAARRPDLSLADVGEVFPAVLDRLALLPEAVVHGDFQAKNLVRTDEADGLVPIDWSNGHVGRHLGDLYLLVRETRAHYREVGGLVEAYAAEAGPQPVPLAWQLMAGGLVWVVEAIRWIVEEGGDTVPFTLEWLDDLVAEAAGLATEARRHHRS